jgi:hypothetical protein
MALFCQQPAESPMELSDVFPPNGHIQRLYCDTCKNHLYLAFIDFHEDVSGTDICISGLPVLRCDACSRDYLPDRSRFAIIELHCQAVAKGRATVTLIRRKLNESFSFTKVPFLYDADDYRYIPGLERSFDQGFLTPVFFNKNVLLKYDASPAYRVRFASPTYGEIVDEGFSIPCGITKNGKLIMWLGDIAKLPEAEQYYLRSENIVSDHAIGSEFYDGQIECIFTQPSGEHKLFALRSEFVETCFKKFGVKIAHLDQEVMTLALEFNPPVVDTEKERRHVADTLTKIYIESFDNVALGTILLRSGGDPSKLGSLKRLQGVLGSISDDATISRLLSPFFVLYDLRVAYSHLTSEEKAKDVLKSVTSRLGLDTFSKMPEIYDRLLEMLSSSFEKMTEIVKSREI